MATIITRPPNFVSEVQFRKMVAPRSQRGEQCGVTTTGPTVSLPTKTVDGIGKGPFTSTLSSLGRATTYFVRAYATNSVGTSYGNEVSFTTVEPTYLYLYAVVSTPTDSESITLKNNSGSSKDLSGWTLGDLNDPTAYNIPNGTTLGQGATKAYSRTTLGFAKMTVEKHFT